MAVSKAQWSAITNDCELDENYQVGTLPPMENGKLLRYADFLTDRYPDVFGTVPASVTVDTVVTWEYNKRKDLVKAHERWEAEQVAIGSVVPPEDF